MTKICAGAAGQGNTMKREDIIRMAEEASGGRQPDGWGVMLDHDQLERFANLVAAAEREACAKVCDELVTHAQTKGDNDAMFAAIACAFAIRERGAP